MKRRQITKTHKKAIICLSLIAILGGIVVAYKTKTSSAAADRVVKEVFIESERSNYENKEPGSWQIRKSAKWIGRGKAEVEFQLHTVTKESTNPYDIMLIADVSGSMDGSRVNAVEEGATKLIDEMITDDNDNKVSIISFGTNAKIESDWSRDKEDLKAKVDTFDSYASDKENLTNYYDAFVKANELLANYQHSDDRNTVIVFLTDGLPCWETPKQVAEYASLKENYPYVIVNAIQYEMGPFIMNSIREVSDKQFVANEGSIADAIIEASMIRLNYSHININDYVNPEFFEFDSEAENNIVASRGTAEYSLESGLDRISWNIDNIPSGTGANLKIKIKLKDDQMNATGYLPTNRHETIITELPETPNESMYREDTPVLQNAYYVYYEDNRPSGCSVQNMPSYETHYVFEVVEISKRVPTCAGNNFTGFRMVSEGMEQFNDDMFVMPENNVNIRATWSSVSLEKTMNGEQVNNPQKLYDIIASRSKGKDDGSDSQGKVKVTYNQTYPKEDQSGVFQYTGEGSNNYANPVYFERGSVNNNNIIFGGFCWYAMRTTETGGVKLLYNGTPNENGYCRFINDNYDASIGSSVFNYDVDEYTADKKHTGYMYGNSESRWNQNDTDSEVKKFIENWYAENMTDYTSYLENTVFCNDRRYTTHIWDWNSPRRYSTGGTFAAYDRLETWPTYQGAVRKIASEPSLECPTMTDRFTAKNMPDDGGGNAMLEYPIALPTADEYAMSGLDTTHSVLGNKTYTYSYGFAWTMSPYYDYKTDYTGKHEVRIFMVNDFLYSGQTNSYGAHKAQQVRPSVSLKPNTYVIGNGTYERPWQIVTP